MSEFRYRAYISYSHRDETWAAWLHRAIESYRVPRHLVGLQTHKGKVPARIRPVFRDRDDLSSATDLEETVKQAINESENLILMCSPEAAASRGVNEEIRYFAGLGRADCIFCIIVEGGAGDDGSLSACFPSALEEIGLREPLAADVRAWADGKRTAKLKLIAGLLGIRLDDLRQRDLQRRRRRQSLFGLGIAAALALVGTTIISQVSERHEREKAEQLATFVVDLGERLKSDADLETLALISAEASRHLEAINSDKLSPETGERVALAIRQMGRVNDFQGKPVAALQNLERSRDLLADLHNKFPHIPELTFELGNAEYYIGNLHNDQGRYEQAVESMENYHQLTQQLLEAEPENPDWMLEVSYSHNNLAALQLYNGKGVDSATLAHVAEAIRMMEQVVSIRSEDQGVADVYATTLAWAADAEFQACNLEKAMEYREKAGELAEYSSRMDPGNNDFKKRYAFALTGIARLQLLQGQPELAQKNVVSAISMLQQLLAADPSNKYLPDLLVYRQNLHLQLLADTGKIELAKALMEELEPEFSLSAGMVKREDDFEKEYIDFLLAAANVELQSGNLKSANQHASNALQLQTERYDPGSKDIFESNRLVRSAYRWWQINGSVNPEILRVMPAPDGDVVNEFRSCIEADSAARVYVIRGQNQKASVEVAYLESNGYSDPAFINFCKQYDLCES